MRRVRGSRRMGRRALLAGLVATGFAATGCAFGPLGGEETAPAADEAAAESGESPASDAPAAAPPTPTVQPGQTPAAPPLPRIVSLPLPGLAVQLAYREPYVYVADQAAGVHIVEVARDQQPVQVGTVGDAADFVAADGDLLLALSVGAEEPLRAWNISAPSMPVEVPVEPGVEARKFSSVSLEGPLGVVSGGTAPMSVLDLSDPGRVRLHVQVDKPLGFAAVRLRDARAYVSTELGGDGRFGIAVYDLATPALPRLLATVRIPNGRGISRVRSAGHFDVSVDVIGHVLYATGEGSLVAIDIRHPDDPDQLAVLEAPPDAVWVECCEQQLVVAGGDVDVFEASNPRRPLHRHRITTPGQARAAILVRDRLYVADGEAGLTVVRL